MKAIIQERYGSPDGLALREIETPVPGETQVLVRVRAASLNAMDWHLMHRLPHLIGAVLRMPRSPVRGGDLAGTVEAVGSKVTRFKPGDEVFGVGIGSFAQYAAASEDRLAPKPRNLTFEQAAAIPIAGCSALQGLRDKGQVKPGQRVLIYGAGGGVGTFAVQIAKALGAHVTAVTHTRNVDLMRSLGADDVIDYTREDFARRAQRFDVVFDNGANRSHADCQRVLVPNGTLVLCGVPNEAWPLLSRMLKGMLTPRAGTRRLTFLARIGHADLVVLKDLAEAGKLSPVIDRQYPLREVPDALRYLGTRQAKGKIVITIGDVP
jgi:NADPH:quinone reductase-like Zn-dependent oxidoreductase